MRPLHRIAAFLVIAAQAMFAVAAPACGCGEEDGGGGFHATPDPRVDAHANDPSAADPAGSGPCPGHWMSWSEWIGRTALPVGTGAECDGHHHDGACCDDSLARHAAATDESRPSADRRDAILPPSAPVGEPLADRASARACPWRAIPRSRGVAADLPPPALERVVACLVLTV